MNRRDFLKTAGVAVAGLIGTKILTSREAFAESNRKISETPRDFRSAKIDRNVFRIKNGAGDLMYLVEGKNRAALIDTGIGVGDLKKYIRSLTDKPVIVLLTHGHVDHASGTAQFDEVYMNHKDDSLFKQHTALDVRKGYLSGVSPEWFKTLTDENFQPLDDPSRFKNLEEGMSFDLGGIHLDIFDLPGHTQGMTAILFRENKSLLTGDGANMFTFLFSDETLGLKSYQKSLKRFKKSTTGKFDKIYCSHGSGDLTVDYLERLLEDCDAIFDGRDDRVPFEFMGHSARIAFEIDSNHNRLDGGIGNIVYDPARILE